MHTFCQFLLILGKCPCQISLLAVKHKPQMFFSVQHPKTTARYTRAYVTRLRHFRNISTVIYWNVPCITQLFTKLPRYFLLRTANMINPFHGSNAQIKDDWMILGFHILAPNSYSTCLIGQSVWCQNSRAPSGDFFCKLLADTFHFPESITVLDNLFVFTFMQRNIK